MTRDPSADIFARSGELGAFMRELDWAKTPLGPTHAWPQSLRTAAGICLSSRFPTVVLWGPEFALLYNEGYATILGAKHPSALGKPIREVWPEIWNVFEPMLTGVISTGVASWSEDQPLFLRRKGYLEECYFTFSFGSISAEEGHVGGIFCSVTETTERVIAERRLRTLRDLGEAGLGVKTVEEACAAAARVLGRNTMDIPFSALYLHGEARAQVRLAGLSGLPPGHAASPSTITLEDEGSVWPLEQVGRRGVAELVPELPRRVGELPGGAWPEPVQDALVLPIALAGQEHPPGFLVAGVSPRRALDEGYRTFFELVVGQIAAAVASAHEYEEERRRAEALQALDRAKTAFFSNVSHEFRTPLTLMLGPLEDALASAEQALRGEALEAVHRNGERLLRLVNSLLDFSRLEAGRTEASYQPLPLAEVTAGLASSFQSAMERAGLDFVVDCPPLSEPFYVDREMWEKIVLNLVSNAFKFTLEGGITVRMRETAGHAVLEVEDTGTGIPEEELPHLFERFHRVRGARSRSFEGTGIGLALVQELIKLHGGTIAVESQVGRGTRFTLSILRGSSHLPKDRIQAAPTLASTATGAESYVQEALRWGLESAGEEPPPAPRAAGPAASSGEEPSPSSRVLIVDDNADMRDYLRRVLGPHFHVEGLGDGLAALESARRQAPDLIISDVMMPRLDGLGLVQRFREDPDLRAIPIILLSARAGPEAAVGGLEAGADDYLAKPFSARELLARVRATLALARMRREIFFHEATEASLREAVQARDEFLSVVSHELKTPLTRFRLQMDLIQRGLSKESRARIGSRLAAADRSVQLLGAQVELMMDISRINTGRLQLRLHEVDLRALVSEAVSEVRAEAERAGSTISFQGDASIVARCDGERIRQVIWNLLSNAVKFGMSRPVEVSLGVTDGTAGVTVADHGIGIAPRDRTRIFERFERAVSARHYSGFGLGLWIARQVVEAHAGRITVGPTPGGGATFTVELPLDVAGARREGPSP